MWWLQVKVQTGERSRARPGALNVFEMWTFARRAGLPLASPLATSVQLFINPSLHGFLVAEHIDVSVCG